MQPTEATPHPETRLTYPLWVWGFFLGAFILWALVNLHWGRGITWDEVEFLQATDRVRQGQVPYRDFFEHHTPLTWFLMAPFEAISHGPGVGPILWLRWVQVPLWAMVLWRLNVWMREDGDPTWVRLAALACLVGTPFFALSALEYRVDTVATLFVILGLDRLRRPSPGSAWTAGALLSLSVITNLRFAPFVVVVALVASCLDLEARSWRLQPARMGRLAIGAVLALLPWVIYMVVTHSFGAMWQRCFVQNEMVQQITAATRMTGTYLAYPLINMDVPGLLLEGGMVIAVWPLLRTLRQPRFLHLLLLAQVANLAFVAVMKGQYLYHFELSLCLAVPFLATALVRIASMPGRTEALQRVCLVALGLGLAVNAFNLVARNDRDTLTYQDQVLRKAAELAPPGSTVLDGCGWLLGRRPAFEYWFFPIFVRNLSLHHDLVAYTAEEFRKNPPGLVISNLRLNNWASEWPEIGHLVITHYLPTLPNLWVPGLSYPFTHKRRQWTWAVPATGNYRLLCRPDLLNHPWFSAPFMISLPNNQASGQFTIDPRQFESQGQADFQWTLDGKAISPVNDYLHLNKGQQLAATYVGSGPMGVMLMPDGTDLLFQTCPPNTNLDYIMFSNFYRPL